MDIRDFSALDLSAAIRAGKIKAAEAVEAVAAEIQAKDEKYNCYIS